MSSISYFANIRILLSIVVVLSFCCCKSEPPTEKYIAFAESMNLDLPKDLNPRLRLDGTKAISKYKFKFYYTLLDDIGMTEGAFVSQSKPQITSKLQSNLKFREFKKDNMTIIYSYSRNDGSIFTEIEITPNEY